MIITRGYGRSIEITEEISVTVEEDGEIDVAVEVE